MLQKEDILFEDNHIIVVRKPQNIPTQADITGDEDMLSLVKEYIKQTYHKPGNVYVGLVHRLDRPTGGVMVFAKTSKAAARLSEQLKTDAFQKTYFAVVEGTPRERAGRLEHYLKKDEKENKVVIVPMLTEGAKKAVLNYKVLEEAQGYSLVQIQLITGRSHQARVQMASLKTPIYGDAKYGKHATTTNNLNLFAVELRFEHPVQKTQMVFRAYPPTEKPMWNLFHLEKYLEF